MSNLRMLTTALGVIPVLGLTQPAVPREATLHALVRRADGAGALTVRVTLTGGLAREVAPGPGGGAVVLKDGAGTVTVPATVALGPDTGAVTFRVGPTDPAVDVLVTETGLRARGALVRLVRDSAGGALRVEAGIPVAK